MMPRASCRRRWSSSISCRLNCWTVPSATCRSSAWYAPMSSCCPVWPARRRCVTPAHHRTNGCRGGPVLAGERHPLRHALVDDVGAHLREPVHVRLPSAVVASLDGVVEEAVHRVAVLLVVLCGVDASLCRDRMRTSRAVLVAEDLDVVPRLAERRRPRGARETGAHHDDVELAPVRRVDQCGLELAGPPHGDGSGGRLGVGDRLALGVEAVDDAGVLGLPGHAHTAFTGSDRKRWRAAG